MFSRGSLMKRLVTTNLSQRGETSQSRWPCSPDSWNEGNQATDGKSSPMAAIPTSGFPSSELQEAHGMVGVRETAAQCMSSPCKAAGVQKHQGGTWPRRGKKWTQGKGRDGSYLRRKPRLASDFGFSMMEWAVLKPMQEPGCPSLSK